MSVGKMSNDRSENDKTQLQELLDRCGITTWDYVICGDGSGSKWGQSIGWGAALFLPRLVEPLWFCGSANDGTVNAGELMAYLLPLLRISRIEVERRKKNMPLRVAQVHIVTDSTFVESQGQKVEMPDAHAVLGAAFRFMQFRGLQLHWHWCRREVLALNRAVDKLSKDARLHQENFDAQGAVETVI